MSIEVWYGSKPHHAPEQETLLKLYQYLRSQQEHFVLLHNFFAGRSNEIDLVLLKRNGIFLTELKHVWDRIVGQREGTWKAIDPDGNETILNPDRPNPFKQVQRNFHSWKNWCQASANEISAGLTRSQPMDWTEVMSYLVLYPDLPQGSQIDIGDWPVQAVGLPTFLAALTLRSSKKVELSRQEMSRIPQLLQLKRWQLIAKPTERLADWKPASFAVLVARGHTLSTPLLHLDELNEEGISIGRDPESDLIIDAPTISRQHAQLIYRDGRWIVRDQGSTCGTFVSYSGDPSMESQVRNREFALKNNSIVRFGPAAYTLLLYKGEEL